MCYHQLSLGLIQVIIILILKLHYLSYDLISCIPFESCALHTALQTQHQRGHYVLFWTSDDR